MLKLLFPKSKYLIVGAVAAVFNAIVRVAIVPILVTPLIDKVFKQAQLEQLHKVLWLGLILIIFGAIMLFIQDASFASLAAQTSANSKAFLYQNLLKRDAGKLDFSSGGLSSRILNDLKDIEIYLQYGIGSLIAESLTILGIIVVLLKTDFLATLSLIGLLIPLVLVLTWLGKRLEASSSKSQACSEQIGNHLQEGFKHHKAIRAFHADNFILKRFLVENEKNKKLMTERGLLASLQTPLTQILAFIAIAAVIFILGQKVIKGSLSLGQMIAYLSLVTLLTTPAQLLPRAFALFKQAASANKRLNDLIRIETKQNNEDFEIQGLALKDLSYAYADKTILENINLSFDKKGLVAIIGESGAGKTTLLNILLRFINSKQGLVISNKRDLSELNETSFRQQISYVPQSTELLQASIKDNIKLGREYSDKEITQVLEELQLTKKLDSLEAGLEHKLQEDGEGISGGERQRIAIARAIISKPKILLLDEPTANLDSENENLIIKFLQKQAQERLIIVVSHKKAILELAEQIYELKNKKMTRLK